MKAAVWYGKHDVRVENTEEPALVPGKVKVKVECAGICGSDLHAYHGAGIQENEPHPVSGEMAPLTMGHEFAGVVTEVGEGVSDFSINDKVVIEPLIYCGKCEYCKRNHYNKCSSFGFVGLNANGGFAEYVVLEPKMLHKLPEQVSLEEGALVEPTAVALHAIRESKFKVGDKVAVFGVGPIGLLTIMAAKAAGATEIYAVDVSPERLVKAQEVGATYAINAVEENAVERIIALSDGGVDVAYEAAGAEITLANALSTVKKGGEVMVISIIPEPVKVDVLQLTFKEASITSVLAYRNIFPEVISLIASGVLDVNKVVTKKISLDHIVEDGLELLGKDKSQAKILVNVQA
ncbi:alcohol dehydrogenase catalytic domain-containing protein [Virgibacillus halodenitrificans]|uniref:2,3-butanediol dehydrogenase n=1 Tax=Virgibacillus halodenitrificans TaxID=1482 RepID=UPI00137012DC|nr:2,3-butanediol dehydrogenase [Virgibacillus halodenitrificans]MYL45730.1 alcohol dehydrogenase catalytic domain-containing protein [Virgibacillus halodenitrificans]